MTENAPALRAADADRDRVALALRDHQVAGRLTLDEFSQRIDLAHRAGTLDELEALTRDLPAETEPAPPARTRKPTRWLVAIMGDSRPQGRWRIAGRTFAISIMANLSLDLRRAEVEGPEATLTIFSLMGNANVVLPEGILVEVSGFSLMGNRFERIRDVPPLPGSPVVRVRSFCLMGNVNVATR